VLPWSTLSETPGIVGVPRHEDYRWRRRMGVCVVEISAIQGSWARMGEGRGEEEIGCRSRIEE
jgi:hypothetical protein